MADFFVDKVINFFSGDSSKLSDKELILRQRYKDLSENKYAKFFKIKTDEIDSSMGQFFYTLYKMILPLRTFMKDTEKILRLRKIVLESFLDPSVIQIVKRLNPAQIEALSKTTPPDDLTSRIQEDIDALVSKFDSRRVDGINRCYNLVMVIFQLSTFDYPTMIKFFDSDFTEGPFGGDPKFSPVKSSAPVKLLEEFLAISQEINPDSDWKTLLKLLRFCAEEELVPDAQFAQMLLGLRGVINSKVLELIIQCGSKNPIWICKPKNPDEHIAEAWLDAKVAKAQESISKINTTEKNKQIEALLKEIFYGGDLERLDYYTLSKSNNLIKRGMDGFTYAEGLNYLSLFLSEYVEKDINDLCDILLIRGQWTNISHSKEVSEAFHQLQSLSPVIMQLDESLSDEGVNGSRLKASLIRVDRDLTQERYINSIVESVNNLALELIENSIQHFSVIDKHLKNLADDIQKKHPEMIVNWRELNSVSKGPLLQTMAENHLRINHFGQLMKLCIQ